MPGAEFTWAVPPEHPAFAGHFPGRPIVPGVVLLDRTILFAEERSGGAAGGWLLGSAKFFSPVGPGETLTFELQDKAGGGLAFQVRSGGRAIASGSLTRRQP